MTRQAPHDIAAEQSVLGAIFLRNHLLDDVCEILCEQDFYRADHQLLFRTLLDMAAAKEPIDFTTVAAYLRQRGKLEEVGGFAYVGALANDTPSYSNVNAYAQIVRDRSTLRQMIAAGGDIAELGYRPDDRNIAELVDAAQLAAMRLGERMVTSGAEDIASLADAYWHMLEQKKLTGDIGIATGFCELDNRVGGLQPSDLVVIAGRPSMGKTALAINIGDFVSRGRPVLIFSMEMSKQQLTGRLLSAMAKVSGNQLKDPNSLSDDEETKLIEAVKAIKQKKIVIDDRGGLSVLQVRAKARKIARKAPLGLVVVDYIQLMSGVGGNRNEEVNEITRSLKSLAKELGCPIIALSQLNRNCEARDNKRPRLSDLRESGGIEQDADIVLGIYRDEVYDEKSPHAGIAEVILLKQRNGGLGTVELEWHGPFCKFENYSGPGFDERKPAPQEQPTRGFGRSKPELVRVLRGARP